MNSICLIKGHSYRTSYPCRFTNVTGEWTQVHTCTRKGCNKIKHTTALKQKPESFLSAILKV